MKVKEIMTNDVAVCRPESDLATVAGLMYHRDCGWLPVMGADGHVTGVITDRDIAIAVAARDRTADRIQVREVMTGYVYACGPEDEVDGALDTMAGRKVRRLPVIDDDGHLKGVLSIDDIVLLAGRQADTTLTTHVVTAMSGICAHGPLIIGGTGV